MTRKKINNKLSNWYLWSLFVLLTPKDLLSAGISAIFFIVSEFYEPLQCYKNYAILFNSKTVFSFCWRCFQLLCGNLRLKTTTAENSHQRHRHKKMNTFFNYDGQGSAQNLLGFVIDLILQFFPSTKAISRIFPNVAHKSYQFSI